jgi:hypothetical protein
VDLVDINNIRNGMFANAQIHIAFDSRSVAVLKVCHIAPACSLSDFYLTTNTQTPNHILGINDIPRGARNSMPDDVCYPTSSHYTLQ